ncbi:unnamed protein product, partial [Choristocarpus tenellus]
AEENLEHIEETVLTSLTVAMREHAEGILAGDRPARPFVTLTYAQSLDGSIAANNCSQ